MTGLLSPCTGRVLPLADCVDPVFSDQLLGPGVLVDPDEGKQTAVAPVSGKVIALHPHAYVVLTAEGVGVLVHLGINTVHLHGTGFDVHIEKGAQVASGDPVVTWDPGNLPSQVDAHPVSRQVPVIAMERPADSLDLADVPEEVRAGEELFSLA